MVNVDTGPELSSGPPRAPGLETDLGGILGNAMSDVNLGSQTNVMGLAHIKTRHIPYNFHPAFETYAVRALEYSSFEITRHIEEIRKIEGGQTEPTRRQSYSQRERKLYKKLSSALLFRYNLFHKTGLVLGHDVPQKSSVEAILSWLSAKYPGGEEILRNTDLEDLRLLGSRRGKLDNFILSFPLTTIGEYLCFPFRTKVRRGDGLVLKGFNEQYLLRAGHILLLTLLCASILVPTALLSYRVVSYPVGVAIVLTFCVLFLGMALLMEPEKPGMQVVLVLAYGAIATTILSNFGE